MKIKENTIPCFEEKIRKYVDDKLKDIWFTSKHWDSINPNIVYYLSPIVHGYEIKVYAINENNIRCEFNDKSKYSDDIRKYYCLSSCVVSDWQVDYFKQIDYWINNILTIPSVKPLHRMLKIYNIKKKIYV